MKKLALIPILLFLLSFFAVEVKAAPAHYRYITVYNPNSYDLTNYQVRIDLTSYTLTDSTGTDVRFYDDLGNPLYFWREAWSGSQAGYTKVFWVKMSIPAGSNKKIKITYADPSAADASSISDVMDFYDDFSSFSNGTRWYVRFRGIDYNGNRIATTGTVEVVSGWLHIKGNSDASTVRKSYVLLESIQQFTNGFEVVYVDKMANSDLENVMEIGVPDAPWAFWSSQTYFFIHGLAGASSNYYYEMIRDGLGGTYIANCAGSYTLNYATSNSIKYYRNGTMIWTVKSSSTYTLKGTDTQYLSNSKPIVIGQGSYQGTNPDRYVDYIYVRKLADTEPTYAVSAEDPVQLQAPVLSSPSDNAWLNTSSVQLSWQLVSNAASYWLQVASDSSFTQLKANTTLTALSYTFTATEGSYYWRVKALGSGSYLDSNWSSYRKFNVDLTPPVVSNSQPANNAVRTTADATLQWQVSDNNQVSAQYLFLTFPNSTVKTISLPGTTTSYSLSNLPDGQYFWQIKAVDIAGNSYTGQKWKFIVDANPPYPYSLAANKTGYTFYIYSLIAHSVSYTVDIYTQSGSSVCSMVGSATLSAGERKKISGLFPSSLSPNTYKMVVTVIDENSVSKTNQTSFTVYPQLQTPVLSSPSDNAWLNTSSVQLSWQLVPNAAAYLLQVATDSAFTQLKANMTLTALSYTFSATEGSYYWRVKALASSGYVDSNWSSYRKFNVDLTPPVVSNSQPANNTVITTSSVTLQWLVSENNQLSAQYLFLTCPNGTIKTYSMSASATSYSLSNLPDGPYYWQIKAVDIAGNSYTGQKWKFIVDANPPYPYSLAANKTGYTFYIYSLIAHSVSYTVNIYRQSGSSVYSIPGSATLSAGENKKISGLFSSPLGPDTYRMVVTVIDENSISKSSEIYFTVNPQLQTPVLSSPADNAWLNTSNVQLSWQLVSNAAAYLLQVATDSSFTQLKANLTLSALTATFSATEGTYYWRVKALGSGSYLDSNWSSYRKFNVDLSHPLITNIQPVNNSIKTAKNVSIQWQASDNSQLSAQYLYVTFPNGTVKTYSVSPTIGSYTLTNLDDGQYFWQIKAVDIAGNSYIGEKWRFIVDTRLPYAPVLDSPANNTWINSDRVTLKWHASDYDVCSTILVVQQAGGTYQYRKTVDSQNGSIELAFTQEGSYSWYVISVDWANNQQQSAVYTFYVVIGSVSPYNLTANSTSFSFFLYSALAQKASYTVYVYSQNGALVDQKTSTVTISAGERLKITGLFTKPLDLGIYRLRVVATDEKGVSKTNETYFIVYSAGQRDWNNWACDLNILYENVNFTRVYFEYGSAEASHQVQLQFQNGKSCSVFENQTKTEIQCFASSSYISFTALARKEGETRVYVISVLADPLLTTDKKVKEVIYQGVKAEEHLLQVKNQYPYDVLKLLIKGNGWLYSSLNSTSLRPLEQVNVTYYLPVTKNETTNVLAGLGTGNAETSNILYIVLFVMVFIILVEVILWRRKR